MSKKYVAHLDLMDILLIVLCPIFLIFYIKDTP